MDFIGREKEMELLNREFGRESSLVIIKGRRRVGKSRLITEFLKDKDHLYYEVDNESGQSILASLGRTISGELNIRFERWSDALKYYVSSHPGKKVIAIDEFQYAVKADPELKIEIQALWDTYLSKNEVMLILCGSSLTSMNNLAGDMRSPLYGRTSLDLTIMPLPFRTTVTGDYRKSVERYAVTGGVPYYMALMDNGDTIENVIRMSMEMGSPLLNEGEYLLGSEFRNLSSYNTYLRAIANGHRTMEKITGAVQAPSEEILPYLKRLIEIGMVERLVPITEKAPEKSRSGQYVISDNFICLWFRFIYPYRNSIIRMENDMAIQDLRDHFIDAHVAFVFENVCREELRNYLRGKGIAAEYGKYWGNGEIDLIALDKKDRVAYVCECKYHTKPLGMSELNSLVSKAGAVKELRDYNVRYCLFSVSGYNDGMSESGALLFNNGELVSE
ncbi:MAG: ATP-binding protein [Candidatus Methanomethylophilaceae archaeon]|nr:ATP-binding protein [Candidatus Methanomethylophilaceae archaeon]